MNRTRFSAVLGAATLLSLASFQASQAAPRPGRAGKDNPAVRGKVTTVSATGFEIQAAARKNAAAVPAPTTTTPAPAATRVTVSGTTRFIRVDTSPIDLVKQDELVAIVGQRQADGKLTATGLLRLGPVSGDQVSSAEQQNAQAIVQASGRLLQGGGGRRGAARSVPPASTTAPAGAPPAPARAKGDRKNPPVVGKVVSISPLKIAQGGQTTEVATDAATSVGSITTIALKDILPGDNVVVLGTQGAGAAGEVTVAASTVIKSAGRQKGGKKANRRNRAAPAPAPAAAKP